MSIAQATATSAIENNSIPSLLFQAGQLALAAYTAHKVYKVYEEEGVKAALKELGYEVVIGVATDQALKVAGTGLKALAKTQAGQATIEAVKHSKVGEIVASEAQATQEIAYKIGDQIYHDAEAAWKAVLAQHPDLEKKFARHLGRFDAEKEIASRAVAQEFQQTGANLTPLETLLETADLTEVEQVGILQETFKTLNPAGKIIKYSPIHPGVLHDSTLNDEILVSNTFRSGTYLAYKIKEPVNLYRVTNAPNESAHMSKFWTRIKPTSPTQAMIDLALEPSWGNSARKWVKIKVPAGTEMFEGVPAPILKVGNNMSNLVGGGNQVYLDFTVPKNWVENIGEFY